MSVIINSHMYLGASRIVDSCCDEEQILIDMKNNHVDASLVAAYACALPSQKEANKRVADFAKSNNKKIFGIATMSTRCDDEEYEEEITRCICDYHFVAVKYEPMLDGVYPLNKAADKAFQTASKLGVPIMVDTGVYVSWSPALLIKRAIQYPELKIVLCHTGLRNGVQEALIAAKLYPNLYLDPSWCPIHHIQTMIKQVGSNRVLMASHGPFNTANAIDEANNMNITEKERADYLGNTAIKLFGLEL